MKLNHLWVSYKKNELQEIWKEIRVKKTKLKQIQIKLELDRIDVQKIRFVK
jgi:hypothetical protein